MEIKDLLLKYSGLTLELRKESKKLKFVKKSKENLLSSMFGNKNFKYLVMILMSYNGYFLIYLGMLT